MEHSKNEIMEKIFDAFYNMTDAIYIMDNINDKFSLVKGTDFFKALTGEDGGLDQLYNALFFKNLFEDNAQDSRYKVFRDKEYSFSQ